MPLHGYTATTKAGLVLDAGQLRIVNAVLSTTRGGVRFDPGEEVLETDFDGRAAPIEGLDRIGFRRAIMTATILQASSANLLSLLPGATTVTGGGIETITPPDARTFIAAQANARAIFEQGDGTFLEVRFPKFFLKWGGLETADRAEGGIPITIEARAVSTDANTILDATYLILKYAAIPSL